MVVSVCFVTIGVKVQVMSNFWQRAWSNKTLDPLLRRGSLVYGIMNGWVLY